jgi:tetratricopeptide (TPR) repeat protein
VNSMAQHASRRRKPMRQLVVVAALLVFPLCLFADVSQTLKQIDALHDQGRYAEARDLALGSLSGASAREQAELYWRAARSTMEMGNDAEEQGKPRDAILKLFDDGEKLADSAIAADPTDNLPYYWKSANIGRWGQVKGILNSLNRAGSMRDLLVKDIGLDAEHADAYYVLGQLYRELPGFPLSFGNTDWGVSLGWLAIDLREKQVASGVEPTMSWAYYTELGKTLWKRNWSSTTRLAEQQKKKAAFDSAKTPLARGCAYEAVVTLATVSDRQEARAMVQKAIAGFQSLGSPTKTDLKDLKDAREVLASFK